MKLRGPSRSDLPLVALVVVAVLVGGFFVLRETGEDDPFADYCAEVEQRRDEIGAAVAAGPTTGLIRALPSFEALEDKAPEDIRDEWAIVTSRIEEIVAAFGAAEADPASYDRENPPADVSQADRDRIEAAAVRLGSRETRKALAGVDQHARDVCKTPLSL
ncbi:MULTISPECIES: hypothetical protein [Nocardioides]|uniref:Uncharacterized protein n=1 Tax=Nocardioides vastitatis TaxID=2568655 RepID=A0ABW0ZN57_9ACTN|nr:hypothetical protein [Nocardioides sp.]THI95362.1 hypothetical protein E7Z54_19400 [Nocardioides sp.]